MSDDAVYRAECDAVDALKVVRAQTDQRFIAGLVAGSGLSSLADEMQDTIYIPFADLPGFPHSSVSGHEGALIAGILAGTPVVLYSGRAHYYENADASVMRKPIALLKALGCETVLLTNSAGSLHEHVGPGTPMLITDHINFSGSNPLFGEPTDHRFVGLTEAYDNALRQLFIEAAERHDIVLARGVYMWFSGPSFETPAEIRMARMMGADAVGMSTVPEAILARFYGMNVAALSAITNLAAGMTGSELSHDETKENAPKAASRLRTLLSDVVATLGTK